MHPTQHSTHTARRAPRAAVQIHTGTISCTADDVLDSIARLASNQATVYVLIAHVRVDLGLTDDDLPWLQETLKQLDEQDQIRLSPYEKPQDLALYIAPWCVRNASGIPCHEVALNADAPPRHRIAPLMRKHAPTLPLYPKAQERSTLNPMVRAVRQTQLVAAIANDLQNMGRASARLPLNQRLAKLFTTTQTGRAA
ncbi:hypothetical protein [Prosthecobacter vanneervenii]|uniref:Uncharacterized protein n=1 Tax=Prosthecobacter vanneervenii TaxID=48466 RepID=A0A7W7YBV5_9BACT|nr:hypothetical protein [Prosthecobacter vanneervenii]MBB5033147.1 hypothetical protein [Prosthecobacter vanneervenii]